MAMVINTNVTANRTHNTYIHNNDAMNKALTRVATGMKINTAKDGASTWAISEKMRERIRANDQANQNVQNDSALLRTAQGGISNTIDILKTLKERALNAANDSNINFDRSNIATEVYELAKQIDDNAQKVKFNGRALLNGATDTTVATFGAEETSTTEETSSTESASEVTEPTAATPATTPGTASVYKQSSPAFKYWDSANSQATAATSNTKLVDLTENGAQAGAKLFKEGDTITFSWKEDGGEEQTKSITVASDTKVSDLAFSLGAIKVSYVTAGNVPQDNEGNTPKVSGTALTIGTVDNSVTANALAVVGDKGVSITDLKVSVTYDDFGTTKTRTEGQDALKFTGVSSIAQPDEGSHSVFSIAGMKGGTTAGSAGNSDVATDSVLASLAFGSTPALGITSVAGTDDITFTVGDKSVTLKGSDTIANLASAFKNEGINVLIGTTGNQLKDLDGNVVTKGSGSDAANVTQTAKTLYFVGAKGESLSGFSVSAKSNAGADRTVTDDFKDALVQSISVASAEDSSTTEETDTSSTPLTFYVGGEANFGIDITINKMDVNSLLGTDAKSFAEKFTAKDKLKIDSEDAKENVISVIDNAIAKALNEQTKLGAIESRLGYTSDNLTTMNENLEAADSIFRDSDIAKEMTNYMKYSVLAQASQYMLAQAGQNAYSVLNLLQQ